MSHIKYLMKPDGALPVCVHRDHCQSYRNIDQQQQGQVPVLVHQRGLSSFHLSHCGEPRWNHYLEIRKQITLVVVVRIWNRRFRRHNIHHHTVPISNNNTATANRTRNHWLNHCGVWIRCRRHQHQYRFKPHRPTFPKPPTTSRIVDRWWRQALHHNHHNKRIHNKRIRNCLVRVIIIRGVVV